MKDFVALVVVNEIDNYFFTYMRSHAAHKLIVSGDIEIGGTNIKLEDLMKIETTSTYSPNEED